MKWSLVHEVLTMKIAEFTTWLGNERILFVQLQSKQLASRDLNYFPCMTNRHFEQGFLYTPGDIIFFTFYDGDYEGWVQIQVFVLSEFILGDDTAHAIRLPFDIPEKDVVFIGPLYQYRNGDEQEGARTFQVPAGSYALYYETGLLRSLEELQKEYEELDPEDEEVLCNPSVWCRLSFVPEQNVEPSILRAEPGFSPPLPLLLDPSPLEVP